MQRKHRWRKPPKRRSSWICGRRKDIPKSHRYRDVVEREIMKIFKVIGGLVGAFFTIWIIMFIKGC